MAKTTELCECGRGPKRLPSQGCVDCDAIDGSGPRQREVISLLRIEGEPVTTRRVAQELGMSFDTAQTQLGRMRKAGFVKCRLEEETTPAEFLGRECERGITVALWSLA